MHIEEKEIIKIFPPVLVSKNKQSRSIMEASKENCPVKVKRLLLILLIRLTESASLYELQKSQL